jgi:hypothetical protein
MANVCWWIVGVVVVLCRRIADRDCEVRGVHTREIGTGAPPPVLESIG